MNENKIIPIEIPKLYITMKTLVLSGLRSYKFKFEDFSVETLPSTLLQYLYLHAIGEADKFCLQFLPFNKLAIVDVVKFTSPPNITVSEEQQIKVVKEKYGEIVNLPSKVVFI